MALLFSGCGGHKRVQARVPVTPPCPASQPEAAPGPPPATTDESAEKSQAEAKPIYTEVGVASWYGSPYHNRRTSNGEIYDQNGMTAAHRTLPLNSVARVTNVKTGQSATVRITDRGPFIVGRMLDLSVAAAKQVDVWRPGLAKVKLEVLEAPAPIDRGGRWCIQIGAFQSKDEARLLKLELMGRYPRSDVLQFTGPTGDWLRIRFPGDDKKLAQEAYENTETPEGAVFLVRLD